MSERPRNQRIDITCPCCQAEVVVDARSGQILSHKEASRLRAGGKDFDSLLAGLDDSKSRAAATFDREMAALEDRDRILDAKFDEALRRAEEDSDEAERPVRPWDLD